MKKEQKTITSRDGVIIVTNTKENSANVMTPSKTNIQDHKDISHCDVALAARPRYRCVYCEMTADKLESIIAHCVVDHEDNVLKYWEYCVDTLVSPVKYGYKSKLHEGIVPSAVKKAGNDIVVKDTIVIIREKQTNRVKINTPIKSKKQDDDDDEDIDHVDMDIECTDENVNAEEALNEI